MLSKREFMVLMGSTPIMMNLVTRAAIAQSKDRVIFAIDADIKNFNIDHQYDTSWFPSTLYFERLAAMDYGPDFKIRPLLAKSWDISPDGLIYTFHLNNGVKWHDGAPFTSKDVKYTFEAIVKENTYSAPPLKENQVDRDAG